VNTHTSLKDRQGEPQWLQTKPLHTINASLVNEKMRKIRNWHEGSLILYQYAFLKLEPE
jgi:hypothetical protein